MTAELSSHFLTLSNVNKDLTRYTTNKRTINTEDLFKLFENGNID